MLIGDNFFLERFYENRKEHVLQNAYLEIDHALQEGGGFSSVFPEEGEEDKTENAVTRFIANLTEKENISVIIMDNTSSRSYTASLKLESGMDIIKELLLSEKYPQDSIYPPSFPLPSVFTIV